MTMTMMANPRSMMLTTHDMKSVENIAKSKQITSGTVSSCFTWVQKSGLRSPVMNKTISLSWRVNILQDELVSTCIRVFHTLGAPQSCASLVHSTT